VLHSFGSGTDGTIPVSGLRYVGGTLYGTTLLGGAYRAGTVFSLTTGGKETVLHSFSGQPDGTYPAARLIDVGGTLYGTTQNGGAYDAGTVFSLTTGGTENVLHSFSGQPDGVYPSAELIDVGGTFYGTTQYGGTGYCGSSIGAGTVFSITPGRTEKVLYSFCSVNNGTDGCCPVSGLIDVGGTLYGTTEYGGTGYCISEPGCGTVFSLTTVGIEKVLHRFGSGTDGSRPFAGLINVRGTLYGTTYEGGAHGGGTIFSITTGGTENMLR
jgi:uncharacterized repeat protein (TIGR03803 family)